MSDAVIWENMFPKNSNTFGAILGERTERQAPYRTLFFSQGMCVVIMEQHAVGTQFFPLSLSRPVNECTYCAQSENRRLPLKSVAVRNFPHPYIGAHTHTAHSKQQWILFRLHYAYAYACGQILGLETAYNFDSRIYYVITCRCRLG